VAECPALVDLWDVDRDSAGWVSDEDSLSALITVMETVVGYSTLVPLVLNWPADSVLERGPCLLDTKVGWQSPSGSSCFA